jgi:hypothetical protein
MKVRTGHVVIALLGVLALCFLSGYQLLFKGCLFWNCAPHRSFTVFDLELPITLFPETSVKSPLHQPSELSGAQEAAVSTIYWNDGQGMAVYNIDWFGTSDRAGQRFQTIRRIAPYALHESLTYRSPTADDYAIGCGTSEFGGYACIIVGRYEGFVLSFHAFVDEAMTIERFQEIAIFIDEQITDRIQQSGDE